MMLILGNAVPRYCRFTDLLRRKRVKIYYVVTSRSKWTCVHLCVCIGRFDENWQISAYMQIAQGSWCLTLRTYSWKEWGNKHKKQQCSVFLMYLSFNPY